MLTASATATRRYYIIYMIGSDAPSTVADCTCADGSGPCVDPEWVGSGDWLKSGHIAMGYSRSPRGEGSREPGGNVCV